MNILFVCTGNICRSPITERSAIFYAARTSVPELHAASAGTRAVVEHHVYRESARALKQMGGDASHHAARQVTAKLISTADLALTMSTFHRNLVLQRAPRELNRTFTVHGPEWLASDSGPRKLADLALLRSQVSAKDLPEVNDSLGRTAAVHTEVASKKAVCWGQIVERCRGEAAQVSRPLHRNIGRDLSLKESHQGTAPGKAGAPDVNGR